jgi:phosphatidylserine/phosphatidylglycerophosphate/cardiolipin synthase-like enzyme
MFPAVENAQAVLLDKIRSEQVRLDVAVWLLVDGEITQAIINKHVSGVPVRVLGDRVSIFESDPNTRASFEQLARAGVPIRLRYEPPWFPEIMHWKAGLFIGQGVVEFGSANWTTFELVYLSATDFKDETAFFTDDPAIFGAMLTQFDRFWADTTYFRDWADVYQQETGEPWPFPMNIDRTRLVTPDYPTDVPGMIWGQGPELNDAMLAEINAETAAIDLVSYRLTVPSITDALIDKHGRGVNVRVFIEPTQYRNPAFPEYWLVGSMADRLWAAGIPIRQRTHQGLTHMKALLTSRTALVASSNFTRFWQRDHNYFIRQDTKPALYGAMKKRFDAMWTDEANYTTFTPQRPEAPGLESPADGASVSNPPTLVWRRAPWAVAFDIYIGPSPGSMAFAGRVNAQVDEFPPDTYSFTPSTLQPSTAYYWRIVSRTFATDVNPALTASSDTWSFTTGGGGGGDPSGPFGGSPVALPGTLQAENFDTGANGIAYFDTTAGNSGGQYRTTDVDIEATTDGGGYNIGYIGTSEWLKYTVNVTTAGTHTLEFRVASSGAGGTFHLEVGGVDKTGPLTIPDTGGWQSWTTLTKTGISLAAGTQVWRIVFDSVGPGGFTGNLNHVRVIADSGGGNGSTPFGGAAASLPGLIQAENFDEGGAGVAYSDTTLGNAGGQYRTTDVDIEATTDAGGGYNVGWMAVGEWLKYTVNVASGGTYTLEFRVAARAPGATFHLEVDGDDKTGPLTIPDTGTYQTWTTVTKTGVTLAAGQQVWRLVIDRAGTVVGNLNYIRVTSGSGGGSTPFSATPAAVPGTIEAENFDNGGEGVAYHDLSSGNEGGQYRSTAVDLEASSDSGGGYSVGYALAGEWLNYTIHVATAGTYTLDVRVASIDAGGTFHIEVNGVDSTGPLTIPNTGGWFSWTTIRRTGVSLGAGQQVIRVVMDGNGATGFVGNFNWFRFTTP